MTPADSAGQALELAGNPNVLTLDKGTSRLGQGCSAHSCLVAIEPYRANIPEAWRRVAAAPPPVAARG